MQTTAITFTSIFKKLVQFKLKVLWSSATRLLVPSERLRISEVSLAARLAAHSATNTVKRSNVEDEVVFVLEVLVAKLASE